LIEQYLKEKEQPFIILRAGAFLDQSPDFILPKLPKGTLPVFFDNIDYGLIYTADLARYAAMAAASLPDSEVNTTVDVGLSTPVNNTSLAAAFSKVLHQPITPKPLAPPFISKLVMSIGALFSPNMKDMHEMIKWVNTGVYVSKNTQRQKQLFGDLPTIEEAVSRYARDNKLIA
jgi:hypothetical protein